MDRILPESPPLTMPPNYTEEDKIVDTPKIKIPWSRIIERIIMIAVVVILVHQALWSGGSELSRIFTSHAFGGLQQIKP